MPINKYLRVLGKYAFEYRSYKTWHSMIMRCTDPKHSNYAGRGITVCKRWLESFPAFLEDMGERPSLLHSIERIDNDGNYEPSNCRWATKAEQNRNQMKTIRLTYKGETLCLAEMARKYNILPMSLFTRLSRGWPLENALSKPIRSQKPKLITFNGETLTLAAWADRLGVDRSALYKRFSRGWPIEELLTTNISPNNKKHKKVVV